MNARKNTVSPLSTTGSFIFAAIRVLASTYVLAKAANAYLQPTFTGSSTEMAFIVGLVAVSILILFIPAIQKAYTSTLKPKGPMPKTIRIEPCMVADPITRNVFLTNIHRDEAMDADFEDAKNGGVTNIFA